MGAYDLNAELAKHMFKKGEASNPTGKNGSQWQRLKSIEIKRALRTELSELCELPGFEHLTKFEYGIRNVVARFMEGDRWAVKFVTDRLFGRVPFEVAVQGAVDYSNLTDEQLLERLEHLRSLVTPDTVIDARANAVLVEGETPEGSALTGTEPK